MSHTYVLMTVSKATYDEVAAKMKEAGYDHVFHDEKDEDGVLIDMHGIALKLDPGDRYIVMASQGQGGIPVMNFLTLEEAIKYVERNTGRSSFGIKLPDGTWHKWNTDPHPSHVLSGDASTPVCEKCGATEQVPGGWSTLRFPCNPPNKETIPERG